MLAFSAANMRMQDFMNGLPVSLLASATGYTGEDEDQYVEFDAGCSLKCSIVEKY